MSYQGVGTVIEPGPVHGGSSSIRCVREGTALDVTYESTAVPKRPYVALKMFAPMGYGNLDSTDEDCSEEEEHGSPASRSPFHPGTPRGDKGEQNSLRYTDDKTKERLCVMCCIMFTPEDTNVSQWKLELELWASVCIPCMSSVLCNALRETVDERPCPYQTARPARHHSPGQLPPLKAFAGHNKHLSEGWRKDLAWERDELSCNAKPAEAAAARREPPRKWMAGDGAAVCKTALELRSKPASAAARMHAPRNRMACKVWSGIRPRKGSGRMMRRRRRITRHVPSRFHLERADRDAVEA